MASGVEPLDVPVVSGVEPLDVPVVSGVEPLDVPVIRCEAGPGEAGAPCSLISERSGSTSVTSEAGPSGVMQGDSFARSGGR